MEIARIEVSGAMARVRYRDPIPAGLVGGTVVVDYSDDIWKGLTKTVVFKGAETRDVVTDEAAVTIPHETVAEPGRRLYVGFYGTDQDGTLVIPTIWADLGMIRDATDPSGDVSTDPSLPVYAQLAQQIGELRDQVENMTPGSPGGGTGSGQDGFSPIAPVTQTQDGAVITITDKKGTTTATIQNGRDGYDGDDGGRYTPTVTQPDDTTMQIGFTPSKPDMPTVQPVQITLPVNPDSGGNVDLTGVVKSVNGITPDENGNVEIMVSGGTAAAIDYDQNVHSVNHRGYSASAPENTIPAYILSRQMGFTYAEADVSFTSDGVAVLLHDSTIDRTSNGSGSISAMTYAEASKYDYGSWKNTKYTGTRIPTFEEFIILCKRIGLHPYIELKQNGSYTEAQIQALVEMVKNCGMEGKITWISFASSYLGYVKAADPYARLGYLVSSVTSAVITTAQGLQTDTNEVFIDSSDYDSDAISLCKAAGLPLEIWTINSSSAIQNMNAYITGVTSDNLIAGKILYDAGMVYEYGIDGDEPVVPDEPDEPEKTLTSISATYSGGNVAAGTNVTALTGIVVTAHYSDGSTNTATGYTLSGTISEGSNVITVSYDGMTTTFTVVGVNESGDDNVGDDTRTLLYNWDFTQSMTDTVSGAVATTSGTQDEKGVSFADSDKYILLLENGNILNKSVEIDVSSGMLEETGEQHSRLFSVSTGNLNTANGSNANAFTWRYNNDVGWTVYNGWGTSLDEQQYPIDFFHGKTVRLKFNSIGEVTLMYAEIGSDSFTHVCTFDKPFSKTTGKFIIGGDFTNDLFPITISGVRIYE